MSVLALTTAAVLLVASPGEASSADADRIAASAGFLLGHAHRCGIQTERVVRAGQLIRELILAAAADTREQEDATSRFAQFFLATAVPDQGASKLVPSCRTVAGEFEKLERHRIAGESSNAASGRTTGRGFRLGDGE
jgi:hypothetical protein